MNSATSCPNCGAPVTKSKCAYCGTILLKSIKDFEGGTAQVRLMSPGGIVHVMNVRIDSLALDADRTDLYADDAAYMSFVSQRVFKMSGSLLDKDAMGYDDLMQ